MTKRLIRKVSLRFFQDDSSGEYGLTHFDTIEGDGINSFNAFWDGMGIFHDVFEHAHEFSKYFRGESAMNIGGEMAAMGALWYFYDYCGMYNRLNTNYYSADVIARDGTLNLVQEAIENGNMQFGDTLQSGVPKQGTSNAGLEWIIKDLCDSVKKFIPNKDNKDSKEDWTERQNEICRAYKDSVTFRKIADLHRYGYRMAARLVPSSGYNSNVLVGFKQTWDDFTKKQRRPKRSG